jgi:putative peptidoglycan lipid II flippase
LIPELARRNEEEQKKYFDTVIAGFSLFAVAVAIVAAFCAPAFLQVLFPKLVALGYLEQLVMLTRIMLLQPILLGLSNILAAVTQVRGRYALYAVSPLLYNLGILAGAAFLYPEFGLSGLAWGVVLGALMHMAIQLPSVISDGYFARLPRIHDYKDLFSTVFVSLPRALALSMTQISFLGLTAIAGVLAPGSIAVFVFAFNLQAVPLAIIGASYSVAAFPTLFSALSKGKTEEFLDHVATAARYVFFWSIPATALIIVLRAHLVRVILGSGRFDWTDTRLTAAVFALLSISLVAQGLSLLLIRGYYAAGRTFIPFVISALTAFATIVLAVAFLSAGGNHMVVETVAELMRLQGVSGATVLALGAAYALASVMGTIALAIHFNRRYPGFFRKIATAVAESSIAGLAALLGAYLMLSIVGPLETGSTTFSVFLKGLAGGLTGIIVAALAYWVVGSREFQETWAAMHGRFLKRIWPFESPVAVAGSAEENTPGAA